MRTNKYFTYAVAAGLLLAGVGCKKFLDVNKNPNNPTAVPVSYLLSNAQVSMARTLSLGGGLGSTSSVYVHQTMGRVGAERYGGSADGSWNTLYTNISNLDVIIKQGTSESRFVYVGIAKILKAYAYSILVDVWGEAPFSQVNQFPEIKQPKFDKGIDIYPQLFKMIDEGVADMNNAAAINPSKPTTDDLIYGGSIANWTKAANTIKLKMYTQIRLVQDVKAQVAALLSAPASLINSQAESFILPFGPTGATDDRHPGYGDYTATQRGGQVVSHWMYEIMKGKNPNVLTNVTDPRIPYYIYNQKTATGAPENCTDYRDGGFITIIFGSNGACRDGSNSNTYSMLGVYPVGGRYDQGLGQTISAVGGAAVAGRGARPHEFITYGDRLYLEAELIQAGLVTGTAKTTLSSAIDASFAQMDYFIINYIKPGSAGAPQTVPAIAGTTAATTYRNAVLTAYDAGTAAKQMELIITEKWLNRIENPVDSYNDYRRTGYPVLFSPAPAGTTTSVLTPEPKTIPVSNEKKYPLSFPFSLGEISLNSSAPPQKVPESFKIFWMP
jgi:hypothetical protein